MAARKGFNFRSTLSYVTDPVDTQFVFRNVLYPTIAGGETFGFDSTAGLDARNRLTTVDPRLAGMVYLPNNGTQRTFRVDLDNTGGHTIRLALGDAKYARKDIYCQILDDATVIATIDKNGLTLPSGNWYDATGVARTSSADWAGNNAVITHTFASTILRVVMGQPVSATDVTPISHLFIEEVAGGGITGSGNLVASRAAVQGSGLVKSNITAVGNLVASRATVQGFGDRIVIGSGNLIASRATIQGAGTVSLGITGSGNLVASRAVIQGAGDKTITGSGNLVASRATIQGSGTVGTGIFGVGSLFASRAITQGTGIRKSVGIGGLIASRAVIQGDGDTTGTKTGVGHLVASRAVINGRGKVGDVFMTQINDDKLAVLGSATVRDGQLAFYKTNGATANNTTDAAYEFLLARGVTAGYVNDMWEEFLFNIPSLPMSGPVSDMKAQWWANSAPLI